MCEAVVSCVLSLLLDLVQLDTGSFAQAEREKEKEPHAYHERASRNGLQHVDGGE